MPRTAATSSVTRASEVAYSFQSQPERGRIPSSLLLAFLSYNSLLFSQPTAKPRRPCALDPERSLP